MATHRIDRNRSINNKIFSKMKTILKVVAQTTTLQVKLIDMSWLDEEVRQW